MAAKSNGLRRALLASTSILAGSSPLAALPAAAQSVLPTQGLVTSGAASIRQTTGPTSPPSRALRASCRWVCGLASNPPTCSKIKRPEGLQALRAFL